MINIDSIIRDLKCSICLEFYSDPRTLNCLHSFCLNCLKQILLTSGTINCPQCRKITHVQNNDAKSIPKNNLLDNLVSTVAKSTKASCPQCKETNDLIICEHCSEIHCHDCNKIHIKNVFNNFDTRISNIEAMSKKLDSIKENLRTDEQEIFKNTIKKMDEVQDRIHSLWQARKFNLLNEIHSFYKLKSEEIELTEFRSRVLIKNLNELNLKKKDLEKSLQNKNHSEKNSVLIQELSKLNDELKNLENKFNEPFSKLDINTNQLKLTCNEIENTKVFKMIIDNVYLTTNANKDEHFLKNSSATNFENKKEIKVKDFFGKTAIISLNNNQVESCSIEKLKESAYYSLGIDKDAFEFINSKTLNKFDDNTEFILKDGRVYLKSNYSTQDQDNVLNKDENEEIELLIAHKSRVHL